MRKTSKIERQIEKLTETLRHHNYLYYVEGHPEISDAAYDKLYNELAALEAEHPQFRLPNSPTNRIVNTVDAGLQTYPHLVPMISLHTDTTYDLEVAHRFDKRVRELLKLNQQTVIRYTAEVKYDGMSLNLVYRDGLLSQALLRGDGETGEDVLENLLKSRAVPTRLPYAYPHLEVRGELLLPKLELTELNVLRVAQNLKPFANCRNAVAGIIRAKDHDERYYTGLIFYAYSFGGHRDAVLPHTQGDALTALTTLGFGVYRDFGSGSTYSTPGQLTRFYGRIKAAREAMPFDIDGVVYKVDDIDMQAMLGTNAKEPKWAVAHKFQPPAAVSTLRKIHLQVGRTGKITPVATIDPVTVGGVVVTSVNLHNEDEVNRLRVAPGDQVMVHRAGDVVPEIIGLLDPLKPPSMPYSIKEAAGGVCPACSGPIERAQGEVAWRCLSGLKCQGCLAKAIEYFASRPAMNIEGLGEVVADQLVSLGLVKGFADLYKLTKAQLLTLPGFAEGKADKLLDAINRSRSPRSDRLLLALRIPSVGQANTLELLERYGSVLNVIEQSEDHAEYLRSKHNHAEFLALLHELTPITTQRVVGPLNGYVFVITGSFPGRSRQSVEEIVRSNGGKISANITRETTHLVCGDNPGTKRGQAAKAGVPVINLEWLIGLASPPVLNT